MIKRRLQFALLYDELYWLIKDETHNISHHDQNTLQTRFTK